MPLMRTLKAIFVLMVLTIGLPAVACAHEGHAHASAGVNATPPAPLTGSAKPEFRAAVNVKGELRSVAKAQLVSKATLQVPASGQKVVQCSPGSCCCQGASSCGSGHCCSFGMTTMLAGRVDLRKDKSFRMAALSGPYPEPIIGFDRPPKA